jgi:H+/Na+-translocating ferredoxin:NAD+ oxidoreductase subunit G
MKDIIKITVSLTGVCIAAAIILGAVYANTEHMRKVIEIKETEETIHSLLGFGHGHEIPKDLHVYPVYRYVIQDPKLGTLLGYVLPEKGNKLVMAKIDLTGKPVSVNPLKGKPSELVDAANRAKAVEEALQPGSTAILAETFYIADKGDKRLGYVLPGITQGFKTFIKLMVSMDPKFTVTGIAITESEEDPGLGAEIEQSFFRNQFIGKTVQRLKQLKVVKKPLPQDYLDVLVPARAKRLKLSPEKIEEIKKKHVNDDIYALTGATISSDAVTKGVKDTVRKFVYRYDILNKAIEEKDIKVAF